MARRLTSWAKSIRTMSPGVVPISSVTRLASRNSLRSIRTRNSSVFCALMYQCCANFGRITTLNPDSCHSLPKRPVYRLEARELFLPPPIFLTLGFSFAPSTSPARRSASARSAFGFRMRTLFRHRTMHETGEAAPALEARMAEAASFFQHSSVPHEPPLANWLPAIPPPHELPPLPFRRMGGPG